jgi:RHS repeat-associated protein
VQTASSTNEYLFNYAGQRTSTWQVSNNDGDEGRIYWGGQQIAFRDVDGTTYFDHQNWLGTERMRTNYAGSTAASYVSLPWGDGYVPSVVTPNGDQDNLHFAQLEHDSESTTEHAQFRQLSSAQGRWMSPDPYDGSYDPFNPQSFNRFSYVLNNPLAFTDPSGRDIPDCSDDGCGDGGGYIGGSGYGSSPGEGDTPVSQGNVPTIQGPGITIYLNPYISTGLIQGIGSAGGIQQLPSIAFTGGGGRAPKSGVGTKACQALSSRTSAAIQAPINAVIGATKIVDGFLGSLASVVGSPVSEGSSLAGLPGSAYLAVGGTGQMLTAAGQGIYAATGSTQQSNSLIQNGSILSGPVTGGAVLLFTGNKNLAATVGNMEGALTAGPGLVDKAVNFIGAISGLCPP